MSDTITWSTQQVIVTFVHINSFVSFHQRSLCCAYTGNHRRLYIAELLTASTHSNGDVYIFISLIVQVCNNYESI